MYIRGYDEHIHPFYESMATGLSELVGVILDSWNQHVQPVLDSIASEFRRVMEEYVSPAIEKAKATFGKFVDAIKLLWDSVLWPFLKFIAEPLVKGFAEAFDQIKGFVVTFVETAMEFIGYLLDSLGGVIDFLVGVFTGDWEKAWNGLKDVLKGTVNAMIALLEGLLNLVIKGLNLLWGGIADGIAAAGALLGLTLNIGLIPEISLPRLAEGGLACVASHCEGVHISCVNDVYFKAVA